MSLDPDDRIRLHSELFDTLDLFLQWMSEQDPATSKEWDKLSGSLVEQLSEHELAWGDINTRFNSHINKQFPALLQGSDSLSTAVKSGILNASGTKGKLALSAQTLLSSLDTLVSEPTNNSQEEGEGSDGSEHN